MAYQMTFQRYELKYLLTKSETEAVRKEMEPYMKLDKYGRTTIRNIYLDTESFRLIRTSMEKPVYKEKIRIRSYREVKGEDPVFVELKKKYKSVVYKRRLVTSEAEAMHSFLGETKLAEDSQIGREISYFRSYYGTLRPTVFLTYEREAYYALDGSDFRVTFDENILYRTSDFSLGSKVYGTPILKEGESLMELKVSGGIPLWMTQILAAHQLYKTSFSKYGTAYVQMKKKMEGAMK